MGYDGVIFDFDGVLIDSGFDGFDWAGETRQKKAREYGVESDLGGNYGLLFQASSFEEFKKLVEEAGLTVEEYVDIERAIARRKVEMVENGEMELFPGARKVLREIDAGKAIVSNAYGEKLDELVTMLQLDSMVDFWTAPHLSEIERYHSLMKPEVEMLERAVSHIDVENPVMVGDSHVDIRVAEKLGIDSVFVTSYSTEVEPEPDYRISSVEELLDIV